MSRKDPVLQLIEWLRSIPWYVPEWRINDFIENDQPAILEILKKHTGQDFGYNYEAWLQWYQEDFYPDNSPENEAGTE